MRERVISFPVRGAGIGQRTVHLTRQVFGFTAGESSVEAIVGGDVVSYCCSRRGMKSIVKRKNARRNLDLRLCGGEGMIGGEW